MLGYIFPTLGAFVVVEEILASEEPFTLNKCMKPFDFIPFLTR